MDFTTVKFSFVDEATTTMEERGISEDDVRQVVAWAEGDGGKLIGEGCFLGKKRLDRFTVYAQYAIEEDSVSVSSAYSHRVTLREDK